MGARFELKQDEDTGRLYWWGAEDGWKDATEVGENGVLTLDAQHFAVGSVLTITEPSLEEERAALYAIEEPTAEQWARLHALDLELGY